MATERKQWWALCCVLGLTGCSMDAQGDAGSGYRPPSGAAGSSSSAGGGAPGAAGSGTAGLPPEMELDQSFRAPVATGKTLWTANPDSGRVALIDAQTLKVRMTNAGFGPTYLAAVPSKPGTDSAIVINVGSHDASFMQATAQEIEVTNIETHVGANAWTISADGQRAIAWTDSAHVEGGASDPVNGYSELTVIDLSATPPVGTRLSVGFRPSQVLFDATAEHAFALVAEGITVLDLSEKPTLSKLIEVPAAASRDVSFSADGAFALLRVAGSPDVSILDLASDARQELHFESNVTDLDISADGTSATAMLGDAQPPRVVSFPVPNPSTDVSTFVRASIPGELVRSVSLAASGSVAVLYTNAVPNSHLTLLDTESFGFRTVDLQGAVSGVFLAPDGATAVALQKPPANSTKKGLFSIVPTQAARAPRIVGTDAAPRDVAFSESGQALVTVADAQSSARGVYVIGLANLEQNYIPLSSEPLPGATGIVPLAQRGFVAQKHPEGRITFIDLDTGRAQTLSGFEIAARVVR